jgi:radical SAM superfamily enzyme YgiQ (UPF0313 family)
MRYHGAIIRPPSEADSLILQVTYGCSHGACSFCGTYMEKPFRVRPFGEVAEDVRHLPDRLKRAVRRVFLADGDAAILPRRRMKELLELLHRELPFLERVSAYATAQALLRREVADLREFRERGLTLLYLGLESGDDATLASCSKGVTVAQQIEACRRAHEAGIALSITSILGLAGADDLLADEPSPRSLRHAVATGEALSAIDPEYIGLLSLMVTTGTPLGDRVARGEFIVPSPLAMLHELRGLLAATDVTDALFRSNHASNYLPVGGRLPQDKGRLLAALDAALEAPGAVRLRPEAWRAL